MPNYASQTVSNQNRCLECCYNEQGSAGTQMQCPKVYNVLQLSGGCGDICRPATEELLKLPVAETVVLRYIVLALLVMQLYLLAVITISC